VGLLLTASLDVVLEVVDLTSFEYFSKLQNVFEALLISDVPLQSKKGSVKAKG
jgi:hypothetical protein